MKPTARLRFVEKTETIEQTATYTTGRKVRVLQQWWEDARRINLGFGEVDIAEPTGEWRDVPLEKTE
jgi:hypothetical protein